MAIVLPYFLKTRKARKSKGGITTDADEVATKVSATAAATAFNESLVAYPEYDFVIVGGGTAGCALAARLSEDPAVRVLVLEAGTSGTAQLYSRMPISFSRLFKTRYDWGLDTEPQANLAQRKLVYPRGKLLGGCSSINAMMFHYGSPSDFDEWARISGDDQWSWANLHKYFMKFESFNEHPDFPLDATQRGFSGPVRTGFNGHSGWCKQFVQACLTLGIPERSDFNTSKGTIGAGRVLTYIDQHGRRSSTETAYLTPQVLARPNLKVLLGAHVTRILLAQDHGTGTKRAVGVEFAMEKRGPRYRVRARREVALTAGAVHTPHILMLSGIGPADHLKTHGIPVMHDLSGVGQNLLDHPVVNLWFRAPLKESLMAVGSKVPTPKALAALLQWQVLGTGPMGSNLVESVAFVRSTERKLFPATDFPEELQDSTSAENAPDIEFLASPLAWKNHGLDPLAPGPMCSFGAVLLRPTSKGAVTLQSSDPFAAPRVDPNFLATPHDRVVLLRAIRLLLRIAKTQPITKLIVRGETVLDGSLLDKDPTDEQLDAIISQRVQTLYHPTSSARMASLDQGGVVDTNLNVHGIGGLRIADASVFPAINSGHTAAPVIAIAEKVADLIKGAN
ncbi:alcohol oxidase [Auricularia subglabra TFB-10046 SS5]|nr:alcohol oxidase [Auricularia subglabra TFB-10046 SS5]